MPVCASPTFVSGRPLPVAATTSASLFRRFRRHAHARRPSSPDDDIFHAPVPHARRSMTRRQIERHAGATMLVRRSCRQSAFGLSSIRRQLPLPSYLDEYRGFFTPARRPAALPSAPPETLRLPGLPAIERYSSSICVSFFRQSQLSLMPPSLSLEETDAFSPDTSSEHIRRLRLCHMTPAEYSYQMRARVFVAFASFFAAFIFCFSQEFQLAI